MQCKIPQMALTLEEKKKLQKFLTDHQIYCPSIKNSCNYSIEFSREGGIGVAVSAKCGFCGKSHDITDYSTW